MESMPLRCVQVVASIQDHLSGPSYSVTRLSSELERKGAQVSLFSVQGWRQPRSGTGDLGFAGHVTYAQDFARVPGLTQLCLSKNLMKALVQIGSSVDVFHAHGLWLMPNVYPAWAARRHRRALVLSPRGMLGAAAMRFSHTKKIAHWHLLQKAAMRQAACVHATSEQEYEEIRAFGLSNPVAVIPNGIDIPELACASSPAQTERVVLSLGRIHPKKGLDRLVNAWAEVEHRFPAWRLRVIGPDELGHKGKLERLAKDRGLTRISLEEPLYGKEKTAALQGADLFVLPSLNENFGLVVAEALAAGTPVIASKETPWGGLPVRGCGWWTDCDVPALAAALADAMAVPRQTLGQMGAKGRTWMAQAFSWTSVAEDMLGVYQWLAGHDDMPPTVRAR